MRGGIYWKAKKMMNVIDAIRTRRTIHASRPDLIPQETLETIIEAGTWAPNHRLTEPWRFTIVGPKTLAAMAALFAEIQVGALPEDASEEIRKKTYEKSRQKALNIPNLIVAASAGQGSPGDQEEDFAAVCAAVQNMQLAAWDMGIGALWSTGRITRLPEILGLLGISPDQKLAGFLYLGYPSEISGAQSRKPVSEVARILP